MSNFYKKTIRKCHSLIILFSLVFILAANFLQANDWSLMMAVVAKVNGSPINKEELEAVAGKFAEGLKQKGKINEEQESKLIKQALRTLVRSKLVRESAKKNDISVGDGDVVKSLADRGMPESSLNKLLIKDDMLFDRLMRKLGNPLIPPSPREVRNFYKQNKKLFEIPRRVRARHITINKATEETRNSELRKAKRYQKEAVAAGLNFKLVAAKRGTIARDRASGGMMLPPGSQRTGGYFSPANPVLKKFYPEEILTVLLTLPTGKVSEVIESEIGFHILFVEQDYPATKASFQKTQKRIIRYLMELKRVNRQREWLGEVVKISRITWHDGEPIPLAELVPPKPKFDITTK